MFVRFRAVTAENFWRSSRPTHSGGDSLIIIASKKEAVAERLHRTVHSFCLENDLQVVTTGSCEDALAAAEESGHPAIIIIDGGLSSQDCRQLAGLMQQGHPTAVSIVLGGEAEIDDGDLEPTVTFHLPRTPEPADLLSVIERAHRVHLMREENAQFRSRVSEELTWAAELQHAVLGRNLPENDKVSFEVEYRPLPELACGGDYYEVIQVADGRYLLLIGDVAGHGVRGALVTVMMKTVSDRIQLRSVFRDNPSPSLFLTELGDQLRLELGELGDLLVTVGACLLDLPGKQLSWASAGHLPLHIVGDGGVRRIETLGPAFGLDIAGMPGEPYQEDSADISPGDRLCLFTDGLIETGGGTIPQSTFEQILLKSCRVSNFGPTVLNTALQATKRSVFTDDVTLLTAVFLR